MFRKALFWTHLVVGVVAGLIILLMSVTGVLLTYEKQMLAWSDRSERSAPPSVGAQPMDVAGLLAAAREQSGEDALPTSIAFKRNESDPVSISFGRESMLVSAYTGEALEQGSAEMRQFFRVVTDWHRWLGVTGEGRANARMITGASNLGFLFIVVSGLYLWLPRKYTWNHFKAVLLFRGGLKGKARDFNWHNVAGFWCFLPLFFVVLSGVVISYPWASNLVYTAVGEEAPVRGKGKGGPPPAAKGAAKGGPQAQAGKGKGQAGPAQEAAGLLASVEPVVLEEADYSSLSMAFEVARNTVPDWQSLTLSIPNEPDARIQVNADSGMGGQPQLRSSFEICPESGAVENMSTFDQQSVGQRARSWMRFVHTGEYYGFWGQTIAGIVSAGGALLVYTGLALAWRRFWAWLHRERRVSA